MNEPMKLLIAYDGSPCADVSLEDLRRAGLPHQVEAIVISVADVCLYSGTKADEPPFPERLPHAVAMARAQAAQAVRDARTMAVRASKRILKYFPTWQVRVEACADSPAWAIVKKAENWQADLVVVGSRGHPTLSRFFLGSVSQTVLTKAPCSVRVARCWARLDDSPGRVIVGVDGSAKAEVVVRAVAARLWPAGSEIRVIAAINPRSSTATTSSLPTMGQWATESHENEQARMHTLVETMVKKLQNMELAVLGLVKEGDPKHVLIEEAVRWGADCIFVGATGHSGLKGFLLGSISTAVAMQVPCSVEIVRQG
ncbi:MAG: hypothetical protein BroJett011_11060 [Chloroflexota bacterium]|nr:MAG: hypothetical protein BroJett011_11060 [Chloroflexota bacterium]